MLFALASHDGYSVGVSLSLVCWAPRVQPLTLSTFLLLIQSSSAPERTNQSRRNERGKKVGKMMVHKNSLIRQIAMRTLFLTIAFFY
jgi:hypothetical protein